MGNIKWQILYFWLIMFMVKIDIYYSTIKVPSWCTLSLTFQRLVNFSKRKLTMDGTFINFLVVKFNSRNVAKTNLILYLETTVKKDFYITVKYISIW